MPTAKIISDKCDNCGKCVEVCAMGVFAKEEDKVVVKKPNGCIGCKACEVQCPKEAIKIED